MKLQYRVTYLPSTRTGPKLLFSLSKVISSLIVFFTFSFAAEFDLETENKYQI